MSPFNVINARNEEEPFSYQKVFRSALRAGASKKLAQQIAKKIQDEVYPGVKTSEIFNKVKALLKLEHPQASLRYNLKEAMRKLGPSGFPFEGFIGELFKEMGFEVKINQHLAGFCIPDYEIDFVAIKDNLIYVGECKYRNLPGEIIHLPAVLSSHARFMDILKGSLFKSEKEQKYTIKTMMVTNTKFTESAIKYGICYDIPLWGWRYPENNGLESLIEKYQLYPITILPNLEGILKEVLVSQNIMLVCDFVKINPQDFSKKFNVPEKEFLSLISEANLLLESND